MKSETKKDIGLWLAIIALVVVSLCGFFAFSTYVNKEKQLYEEEKNIQKVEQLMNRDKSIHEKEYEHEVEIRPIEVHDYTENEVEKSTKE